MYYVLKCFYLSPMKRHWGFFLAFSVCFFVHKGYSQLISVGDSSKGLVSIGAYVDGYYTYYTGDAKLGNRPYAVSHSRDNEFNVNVACLDVNYLSKHARGRFMPAFGTYMAANYAAEPAGLQNIMEAWAGLKLSPKREIWLDMGIFGSPIMYESPLAGQNLLLTRSLGAEYSPYYLSGARLSIPLNPKYTLKLYVVNGWQQIADVNTDKSAMAQLEIRTSKQWLVNINLWAGNEANLGTSVLRTRYFADFYAKYAPHGSRIEASASSYYGVQKTKIGGLEEVNWFQANVALKYAITKAYSIAARAEYFSDPESIIVQTITNDDSFYCRGLSLCFGYQLSPKAQFRIEGRNYSSYGAVFLDKNNNPVKNTALVAGSISLEF